MKQINCFLACNDIVETLKTVEQIRQSPLVQTIYLLVKKENNIQIEGCQSIETDSLQSAETIRKIAKKSDTEYSLIYTKDSTLELGQFAIERLFSIARDTQAGMVYSDYYEIKDGVRSNHPVIDYQEGSLRDDFNFGSVLFYNAEALRKVAETTENYQFAGLYNLRLKVSQQAELVHINEYLYSEVETDTRKSGEKQFATG
jgi:hypothetical protein